MLMLLPAGGFAALYAGGVPAVFCPRMLIEFVNRLVLVATGAVDHPHPGGQCPTAGVASATRRVPIALFSGTFTALFAVRV